MCISATFCCSYLRYYFLYLSYQGLFRGRRAKRLMATGLCHGGWGAAIINFPHQRSKPRPCLLLCGLRCGRGFVFTACLGVPWQGQQNFTFAMQSFSVTRYSFERQNVQYLRNGVLHLNNILRPRHKKLSTLMIYSTTKCQSRCKHCSIWQKSEEHLSLHNIQTIMASQCITKYKH